MHPGSVDLITTKQNKRLIDSLVRFFDCVNNFWSLSFKILEIKKPPILDFENFLEPPMNIYLG
jgi:hypothetical protein